MELDGTLSGDTLPWLPQRDLLGSRPDSQEFVAESENEGSVYLRFGDDRYGKRPDAGTRFMANYRVGNGTVGNVGAESIAHIVSDDGRLDGVTNPIAAQGGVEPETAEDIRRDAPEAFRVQQRAVTEQDYEDVSLRRDDIQRAAATFRWTGSWQTVFVSADRKRVTEITPDFEADFVQHLDRYRMAGYDLEIDGPRYVALQIELDVCVKPDYFRAHVREGVTRGLGRRYLADGSRAFFHPDNFSFGQSVYLSRLYAAAMAVPGVESVVVKTFQRLHSPDPKPLDEGVLHLDRLEIARLDNDPSFPDRGILKLTLGGGK
jgi:predicted phage baseplate assembly protein